METMPAVGDRVRILPDPTLFDELGGLTGTVSGVGLFVTVVLDNPPNEFWAAEGSAYLFPEEIEPLDE